MNVEGCVGLVTGGNRGIGAAFVEALCTRGATRVYVAARNASEAAEVAARFPGTAVALQLDVTSEDDVAAAARRCTDVSLLINNAGCFTNRLLIGAPDMSGARQEMEVNYFGPLAMSRAFAPILARNGGGAIVNVLSAAALCNVPNMGGYPPSKSAARSLSAGIRAELADQGTQVTALIVGSVDTRMASHVQGAKEKPLDIALAGLRAIERNIDELDTDPMAVEVRAQLALDPKGMERRLARLLKAGSIRTGR